MELVRQMDENENPLTGPQKARKRKETSREISRYKRKTHVKEGLTPVAETNSKSGEPKW